MNSTFNIKFSIFPKIRSVFGICYEQGIAKNEDTNEEALFHEVGLGIGILVIWFNCFTKKSR